VDAMDLNLMSLMEKKPSQLLKAKNKSKELNALI
jgi:hypothetical protein